MLLTFYVYKQHPKQNVIFVEQYFTIKKQLKSREQY